MTTTEQDVRAAVASARRVVVKVGSSSLASARGGIDDEALAGLVDTLAVVAKSGREVVLVTSGAIAAGCEPLGLGRRPVDLAQQQAAAAVGQGLLIARYTQAFAKHGLTVAQVLLSVGDIARRTSYANALRTFGALTRLGVVPIVNENDTVATREIRFGDNDRLAALVAELVRARALVLLSDVDALYTARPDTPGAEPISFVPKLADLSADVDQAGTSGVGSGGMVSKIEAAGLASAAGIPVILTSCAQVGQALAGEPVGTAFAASTRHRPRRLLWLADASETQGRLHVDAGAVKALTTTAASLLAAGITAVDGTFDAGDPVEIVGPDGRVVARGLVGFASHELPSQLGVRFGHEVVHRDDLVLTRKARQ
ncbi:MAG: glutamate 5-kinase [Propionibacteriaceae bacterium]|nr:glutamate 5-kinase [Propionibacteriaceae bacterium]